MIKLFLFISLSVKAIIDLQSNLHLTSPPLECLEKDIQSYNCLGKKITLDSLQEDLKDWDAYFKKNHDKITEAIREEFEDSLESSSGVSTDSDDLEIILLEKLLIIYDTDRLIALIHKALLKDYKIIVTCDERGETSGISILSKESITSGLFENKKYLKYLAVTPKATFDKYVEEEPYKTSYRGRYLFDATMVELCHDSNSGIILAQTESAEGFYDRMNFQYPSESVEKAIKKDDFFQKEGITGDNLRFTNFDPNSEEFKNYCRDLLMYIQVSN